jgi:hypothetical protein
MGFPHCWALPLLLGVLLPAGVNPATAATAKSQGTEGWMIRMMYCVGEDATMEVYLPLSGIGGPDNLAMRPGQTLKGYYALDLTRANKGKSLEPVRITMSADQKTIIVDQHTRGLPPTRIPVEGGIVDFDQRFGTGAKCGPFRHQDPDYGNPR